MTNRRGSYLSYSVGCAVVWAAILGWVAAFGPKATFQKFLTVCSAWWMGWTSATIARWVYPPPKRYAKSAAKA